MRQSSRSTRRRSGALAIGGLAALAFMTAAVGSVGSRSDARRPTPPALRMARTGNTATARVAIAPVITPAATRATTTATTPATTAPVGAPAPTSTSGNARLDALLPMLPAVLSEGGAHVHFGYNPVDCCHAGGYNPGPNDVWVSERALASETRLVYVTVHELGHSLDLHSPRGAALDVAVTGAPVVRAGSPWDASEKIADCVAWVLYPAETAASGITYWNCPDPWRSQVRNALD